jgi:tRNA modification GTPase
MATITPHINGTICAIATPSGSGGIAVIRVSGNDAMDVCDKIFKAANAKKMFEQLSRHYPFEADLVIEKEYLAMIDEKLTNA